MPARKNSPMAAYFVQMREFERRLLIEAIQAADGDIAAAGRLLGVTQHYVRARAKFLGGVVKNEPKHEPPGAVNDAWNATHNIGTRRKKAAVEEPNGESDTATGSPTT